MLRSEFWRIVSVGLFGIAVVAGCRGASESPASASTSAKRSVGSPAPAEQASSKHPIFDGSKAFKALKAQCDFGPRPVGSEAHQKTRDWLVAEMKKFADETTAQDFTYKKMPLTNVIGVFNPTAKKRVLLCAHWDTRPTADQELDATKKRMPILGANDGASGVGVLLELARILKEQPPTVGVVLVFLDGEDYGDFQRDEGVFLGSRYFAKTVKQWKCEYGILLDMVGDRNLDIYREESSQLYAPAINLKVFAAAKRLGYGKNIIDTLQTNVVDDHIPLNKAGLPTIDLIDFNYGPWHTLDDTPDKCSAQSLKMVGDTLLEVLYTEK